MGADRRRATRARLWSAVVVMAMVLGLIGTDLATWTSAAAAATLDVCPSGCRFSTIQPALDSAVNGDVISIGPGIYTEALSVAASVTLVGAGRNATYIDGGNATRPVIVAPDITVEISDLTIRNGRLYSTALPSPNGAGVYNDGDLTVRRVDIVDNFAADGGGGIFTRGPLAVLDSTISRNQAMTDGTGVIGGGGIAAFGSAATVEVINSTITGNWAVIPGTDQRGGGAIAAKLGSDVVVTDSTIAGNASGYSAGGIYLEGSGTTLKVTGSIVSGNRNGTDPTRSSARGGGLAIRSSASATIVDSTISGNIATGGGGGIQVDSSVTIENSTISGNSAAGTGGGIYATGSVSLSSVTIFENAGADGGGIYTSASTPASVSNSVIAGNTATTDGPDCDAALALSDVALVQTVDPLCVLSGAGSAITGVSPMLGPLQDNGGPTPTHLPADGSPVIDAGSTSLTMDQRGLTRPSGPAPDVGSVEVQGTVAPVVEVVPNWAGIDTRVLVRSLPIDGASCGWFPAEPVEIRWDDIPLRQTTADVDGCVSATVFLSSSEQLAGAALGTHKIVVKGQASSVEAQAPFELVEPQLHVFPFSAAPGSPVSITGCGWNPDSAVNVFWLDSGAQIAGTLADSAGCIDDTARLPQDVEGYHAIGADPGSVAPDGPGVSTAALVELRSASFTMDPIHGPPGEHVDLAGCNWFPGETVDFYWLDTNALLAEYPTDPEGCLTSVVTDPNGVPQVFVEIPSGVATGDHQIGARGNTSGQRVQRTFTVTEAGLILDPVEGVPGTVVAASGCGWEGNGWVDLEWQAQEAGGQSGDHPYLGAAPVDPATGCFGDAGSFTFSVPDNTVAGQSVPILATGDVSGQATADFYAIHDGTISIPQTQLHLGDTFTVEIHGAIIGESVKLVWRDYTGGILGTFPATARDLSVQVQVPVWATVGPQSVEALGDKGFDASAPVELLDTAAIQVSPGVVSPGVRTTITGTDWSAYGRIDIELRSTSGDLIDTLVSWRRIDESQTFSETIRFPEGVEDGTYRIVVTSDHRNEAATPIVVLSPTATVDPQGMNPGGTAQVSGENWVPGELLTFGLRSALGGAETQLAAFAYADGTGLLDTSVNIPNQLTDGGYDLVVHGAEGHDAVAPFWVGERTVALTVTEVNLLGTAFDGDVAPGDLYPRFVVDAPGFTFSARSFPNDHTTDVQVADPGWTVSYTVPSSAPRVMPIEISLFDWDSGSDPATNTQADVSPDPSSLSMVIPVDLVDGTWPGAPTNQQCYQGDVSGLAVEMCVVTSVVSSTGDIDQDGFWDAWEMYGIDRNGDSTPELDLPGMGASPCRKTIGLDYASFLTRDPLQASLAAVVAAFDRAPIDAPAACGVPGVDPGPGVQLLISWIGQHVIQSTTTCSQLFAQRAADQSDLRHRLFHYALFANSQVGSGSSGIACGQGSIIITLGTPSPDPLIRQMKESSTLMHELGHSIGLQHGGFENTNFKPNYLSVMNYRYQLAGQFTRDGVMWILDYSRERTRALDEEALTEAAITARNLEVAWVGPDHESVLKGAADANIDWNDDGPTSVGDPYVQDLNGDAWCVGPGLDGVLDTGLASGSDDEVLGYKGKGRIAPGPDGICDTAVDTDTDDKKINGVGFDSLTVLEGYDDWQNIKFRPQYNRRGFGVSGEATHLDVPDQTTDELTAEAHRWLSPELTVDMPEIEVHVGQTATGTGTVDDPNGDPITLDASIGSVGIGPDGLWTWTHTITEAPGRHTVTITANDGTDGSTQVTFAFDVVDAPPEVSAPDSASVQYSDLIDPITVTVDDADSAPGSMELQASGLPQGLSLGSLACVTSGSGSSCSATIEGAVVDTPGTYPVELSAGDGIVTRTAQVEIVVLPEDAALRFHGGNPVALKVDSGGDSGPFEVMVKIDEADPDLADGTPASGDLTRATTSIRLVPIGSGSPIDPTGCDRRIDGTGYDQELTVVCRYDDVPVDAYAVSAEVGGSFQDTAEDVLVVYDPASGFSQGAGTFAWPGTDDIVRFGFSLSYNKKGTNVRGGLMMVRTTASGDHYVVKSNALYGLALSDPRASTGWASIAGKATYDAPDMAEPEGNHEFVVYAEDGVSDRFWIEVHDKDGSVIASSSMTRPGADWAVVLDTGDVVVPHGGGGRSIN